MKVAEILIGIFLIGLGIYVLLHSQFFFEQRELSVNIKPLEKEVRSRLPAFFGSLAIIAGFALLLIQFFERKK